MNLPVPECDTKSFFVELPNDSAAKHIVIFGNGYTASGASQEIGRFSLQ